MGDPHRDMQSYTGKRQKQTKQNKKKPHSLAKADKQTHALTSSSLNNQAVESARQISALPKAGINGSHYFFNLLDKSAEEKTTGRW